MIIPHVESEELFSSAFAQQGGLGMPHYRGSPMLGGSFWGRVIGFAKGLFSRAAPAIGNIITKAQPLVKKAAAEALDSAIDNTVTKVSSYLKKQEGAGKPRRQRLRVPRLPGSKIK